MNTKVLQINLRERQRTARALDQAAKAILAGGIVIYPTETAYGMGADATNPAALKKVCDLKKREIGKALSIITADLGMMREYGNINPIVEYLANAFLPGPLTLVVEKTDKLPDEISPDKSIAFRIPSNHFARGLVSTVGSPITATSANISGESQIYRETEVIQAFDGKVPIILTTGDLAEVPPSTILDTRIYPPKILREGPIPWHEIKTVLDKITEEKQ
ncbi:threonylcarbamoyl-AMP synthase [Candidatus Micrarchaeota archaeon CG1_02_55_22]|nr:MAG: threonylcarbamoyl-AMP synthase [Candidatus Micrarchaeota archaeon CG1_02_55_22]